MPDRFYCPPPWSPEVELDDTEAHHLLHVLRARAGTAVEIFDGEGRSADGELIQAGKRKAIIKVTSPVRETPSPTPERVLAVAFPKGDRLKWMIEKVTELGIDRIVPLKTRRSVVEPQELKRARLTQTSLAACKQCGRNRVLQIDPPCLLAELPTRFQDRSIELLLGSPPERIPATPEPATPYKPDAIIALIGPEGGFAPEEEEQILSWGARPVSLSPWILRIETAAIAFASCLYSQNRPLKS
jgi:16S rRNA (uracil1498-N3)-methyltransferase